MQHKGKGGKGNNTKGGKNNPLAAGKGQQPLLPPQEPPPWLAHNASPSPATSSQATAAEQQLAQWTAILKKQEAQLPSEVQALLHQQTWSTGQENTKSLHQAVSKYGAARKQLQAARLARTGMHQAWRQYMSEAIERWSSYFDYFSTQDKQLEEEVNKAYMTFMETKASLAVVKEEVASKDHIEVEVISDDEMSMEKTEPQALIRQDLRQMVETFSHLKARADAALEPIMKRPRLETKTEDAPAPPVATSPPVISSSVGVLPTEEAQNLADGPGGKSTAPFA